MQPTARVLVVLLLAVVAVIFLYLAATIVFPVGGQVNIQSNVGKQTECGFSTLCMAENPSGFILTVALSSTNVEPNGSFGIGLSLYNPTMVRVNMSWSNDWLLRGLTWGPCGGGTYPFGVMIFRGYYALSNVTLGRDVLTYGEEFCVYHQNETAPSLSPMTSLVPESLPAYGQVYAMQGKTLNEGNFTSSVSSIGSSEPAVYTLVAGDEWGDFTVLHFSVSAAG